MNDQTHAAYKEDQMQRTLLGRASGLAASASRSRSVDCLPRRGRSSDLDLTVKGVCVVVCTIFLWCARVCVYNVCKN
jgi:hypothetical protein